MEDKSRTSGMPSNPVRIRKKHSGLERCKIGATAYSPPASSWFRAAARLDLQLGAVVCSVAVGKQQQHGQCKLVRRRLRQAEGCRRCVVVGDGDVPAAVSEGHAADDGGRLVQGSLADSCTYPEFGAKRTVEITCVVCGKPHRLATSDVFHTSTHPVCKKEAAKAARKATRIQNEQSREAKRKAAAKASKNRTSSMSKKGGA